MAELKFAGYDYDMVVPERASGVPLYLYIDDEIVELRDGSPYWGKGALDTEGELKKELGEFF